MFNQDFASWSSLTKAYFGPFLELQRTTMPLYEKMSSEMISLASDNAATSMEYVQTLNKTNKLEDYVQANINIFTKQIENGLHHAQNILKLQEKALEDYRQLMNQGMSKIFTDQELQNKDKSKKHNQ